MELTEQELVLMKLTMQDATKLTELPFNDKVILARLATKCVISKEKEKMRPFFTLVHVHMGAHIEPNAWYQSHQAFNVKL